MLVLSRRVNEKILIGDDIEVMVTAIKGDQVQIGITAPRDIEVHRSEVYAEKLRERREKTRMEAGGKDATASGPSR